MKNGTATLEVPVAPIPLGPEEPLYEIVNGERVELPPMGAFSTLIGFELAFCLEMFVRPRRLGKVVTEMLFVLDAVRDIRRRPDAAFVSAQRWPLDRPIPESGDWEVVPNLAAEVISPNDVFQEVVAKLDEYFQRGVQQVWIVVPSSRKVHVYDSPAQARILTTTDELDAGTLLPGFRLPVSSLFQPQQPAGPASSATTP